MLNFKLESVFKTNQQMTNRQIVEEQRAKSTRENIKNIREFVVKNYKC